MLHTPLFTITKKIGKKPQTQIFNRRVDKQITMYLYNVVLFNNKNNQCTQQHGLMSQTKTTEDKRDILYNSIFMEF